MVKLRLGIGIACLPLATLLVLQSSLVAAVEVQGLVEGAADSIGASAGFRLAGCLLLGGLAAILGRKTRAAPAIAGVLVTIGGIVTITNRGIFIDLVLWSILAFILAGILLIAAIVGKKSAEPADSGETEATEGKA